MQLLKIEMCFDILYPFNQTLLWDENNISGHRGQYIVSDNKGQGHVLNQCGDRILWRELLKLDRIGNLLFLASIQVRFSMISSLILCHFWSGKAQHMHKRICFHRIRSLVDLHLQILRTFAQCYAKPGTCSDFHNKTIVKLSRSHYLAISKRNFHAAGICIQYTGPRLLQFPRPFRKTCATALSNQGGRSRVTILHQDNHIHTQCMWEQFWTASLKAHGLKLAGRRV